MKEDALKETQIHNKQEKLYLITHSGLPPNYQLPQIVHAAIQFANNFPNEQIEWFNTSNTIVILATKDEDDLIALTKKLEQDGIKHSKFYEPDINNALTSIAIVPGPRVKKYCSNLPLAGKMGGEHNEKR